KGVDEATPFRVPAFGPLGQILLGQISDSYVTCEPCVEGPAGYAAVQLLLPAGPLLASSRTLPSGSAALAPPASSLPVRRLRPCRRREERCRPEWLRREAVLPD